jgi:RNA methyltransferase, TrmH family
VCPDITSRQHRIVRAFRSAAAREGETALLDGWHLLHEADRSGAEILVVAVAGSPPAAADATLLQRVARRCDVITVSAAVMDAISPTRTPSGVAAIVKPQYAELRALLAPPPALVIVAIDVQDPGNIGAMIRSAEAGGATGVVAAGSTADPWGWKALRAAMGSTLRLPLRRDATAAALIALRRHGLVIVATSPRRAQPMHQLDFRRPMALLLGSEGPGLDDAIVSAADERVSIPMSGRVESLNVAVTAALLVYEAQRQRTAPPDQV